MNKKGFTLIELIVSIVLVSVILTSMLATLVKLRDSYSVVYENTDALIFSSTISRVLNNDLNTNGGIRYMSCDVEGTKCDILLANNKRRKLEIINVEAGKRQEEGYYCEIKYRPGEDKCRIKKLTTTLKYYDTTISENPVSPTDKLIYMKTLSLEKNTSVINNQEQRTHTTGYIFGKLSYNTYTYDSVNKFLDNSNSNPYKNRISSINIQIYDGIDLNDASYDVALYSTSTYPPGVVSGDKILISFDNMVNSYDLGTVESYHDELVIRYGIDFNVYNRDSDGNIKVNLEETKKIIVPKASNTLYKFAGYYEGSIDASGNITLDEEKKIIDENGNILVNNTYFIEDNQLYAKWIMN